MPIDHPKTTRDNFNHIRTRRTQVTTDLPLQLGPEETLRKVQQIYDEIKKSTGPIFNFFMAHVLGGVYASLCSALVSPLIPHVLLTNFPAKFDKNIIFAGHECIDTGICCGLMNLLGKFQINYQI